MAKLDSPHWNEEYGVCTKHGLPEIPCPQCIATKDEDIIVLLGELGKSGWIDDIEGYIPIGFENHQRI